MPVISIDSEPGRRAIAFTPGPSLRDILHAAGVWTTSWCSGTGTCGLCRVRVDGPGGPLKGAEAKRLSSADVLKGIRLACQLHPATDLRLSLDTMPTWHDLPEAEAPQAASLLPAWYRRDAPLGAAVDLGTTHVRLGVRDVGTGTVLARRWALNPQLAFGGDVLVRLAAASTSARDAQSMRVALADVVGDELRRIALKAGHDVAAIGRVVVVGNTSMLALMAQCDPAAVLDPDNWTAPVRWQPQRARLITSHWRLARAAEARFARPLAGFIGSDLMAAIAVTRLCQGPAGSLLIDFGTNSEIALWDGRRLWVTSAAGGPAFEGSGTTSGMAATRGAIRHVTLRGGLDRPAFDCETIGGGPGEGLTGPAVVDAIDALLATGLLKPTGVFTARSLPEVLIQGEPRVVLTARDIDVFQRAKAAIGAGVALLLRQAGTEVSRLRRVCVCGVFGQHLRIDAAQRIGLLPPAAADVMELHGQAALAGAERWLYANEPDDEGSALAGGAQVLNLALEPSYDACFVEHLRLEPMVARGTAPC